MGIIVDLLIVIALALFILTGYKKGLTGSLIKLLSFVIAVVVAFVLYKPVANGIVNNTKIDENIKTSIINILSGEKEEQTSEKEEETTGNFLQNIEKDIEQSTQEAKEQIIQQTAEETTKTVVNVASWLVIFLVARILLIVLSLFMKEITKLPLVKQVDKIGGIAYGLIEGMLIIYVVLGIISLTSIMWVDNGVVEAITKSFIGEMLYNNNIILNIVF